MPSTLRVFLGIACRASQYEHRALMRVTMLGVSGPEVTEGFSPLPGLHVTHRFIVCGAGASTIRSVSNEKDVMVLGILNTGKGGACGKNRGSVELFQTVDRLWPDRFDWILKSDYDAYIALPNLLRALAPLPRADGYFGIHCISGHFSSGVQLYRPYRVDDLHAHGQLFWDDNEQDMPDWFMCGMLYGVTADVAHWLRTEAAAPRRKLGAFGEDMLLRTWLHAGKRGRRAYTCGWSHCYDLPYPGGASQNALPANAATRQHDPRNYSTPTVEKTFFARNRDINKEVADGLEDERRGHLGMSARIAAWLAYGHAMLSQTVVVHNIKTYSEYVAVAAYFERYKQMLARQALDTRDPQWTLPFRTQQKEGEAKADFLRFLGACVNKSRSVKRGGLPWCESS